MYRLTILLCATLFLAFTLPAAAQQPTTERVSVASDGTQGDGAGFPSWAPDLAISADGRYVAFTSAHTNLVPGDGNNFCWPQLPFNCQDVFVHDRETGTTERVSVASDGTEGNHFSAHPAITPDGRYVTFTSYASNLVPGDTQSCGDPSPGLPATCTDIFVHDRETGTTEMVSVDSNGYQGNERSVTSAISADGRYVMFSSLANNLDPDPNACVICFQVYVHDRETGTTERVSVDSDGNPTNGVAGAVGRAMSVDGRYAVFASSASNLVPGDTNGSTDVFVHDRETGTTERVSLASDGAEGNSSSGSDPFISADGRYVVFRSAATNLVPGDTNGWRDVFVHDRETGTTERVSVASDGTEANDHTVAFTSPMISDDGRYVSFGSHASNLVPGDTNGGVDIFVHDRETGTTERVSVAHNGAEANAPSGTNQSSYHAMNADGRYVAFFSGASNLVPEDDTNDWWDIFVRDRAALIVAIEDDPTAFHLSNATPNPASGSATLTLRVPEAQNVTARVYDALGRQVDTIHNGPLAAGEDVRLEIDTAILATGAYLVRVEGETFAETRRFTVIR